MPHQADRRMAIFSLCMFAAMSLSMKAAHAQFFSGPEPQPGFTQATTSGAGAPIFRLPNFVGDRRVDDLYYFMHPVPQEPWDAYRKRLQAAAGRTVNMQPLQQSPTPGAVNNAAGNLMTGIASTAGSAMGSGSQSNGNMQMSNANELNGSGTAVTTSVTGQVLNGEQVPGLVD